MGELPGCTTAQPTALVTSQPVRSKHMKTNGIVVRVLYVQSAVLVLVMEVERFFRCAGDDLVSVTTVAQRHNPNKHARATTPAPTERNSLVSASQDDKFHTTPILLSLAQRRRLERIGMQAAPLDEQIFLHPKCFEVLRYNAHTGLVRARTGHGYLVHKLDISARRVNNITGSSGRWK